MAAASSSITSINCFSVVGAHLYPGIAPTTLKQLIDVIEELAAAMDPMEVTRAVSSLRRRAPVCVVRRGAPMETAWVEAD